MEETVVCAVREATPLQTVSTNGISFLTRQFILVLRCRSDQERRASTEIEGAGNEIAAPNPNGIKLFEYPDQAQSHYGIGVFT